MNRFHFEEVLFDALYAPMRAAWDALDAEPYGADVLEIEDIVLQDNAPFILDC
ncbi:MAG: hypothetical protein ABIP49_08610 [Lysobacterales bacterium]